MEKDIFDTVNEYVNEIFNSQVYNSILNSLLNCDFDCLFNIIDDLSKHKNWELLYNLFNKDIESKAYKIIYNDNSPNDIKYGILEFMNNIIERQDKIHEESLKTIIPGKVGGKRKPPFNPCNNQDAEGLINDIITNIIDHFTLYKQYYEEQSNIKIFKRKLERSIEYKDIDIKDDNFNWDSLINK